MPRGFLVKRNKKPNWVSYRVRADDEETEASLPPPPSSSSSSTTASLPFCPTGRSSLGPAVALLCAAVAEPRDMKPAQFGGNPEAGIMYQALCSPTRPVSRKHDREAYLNGCFNLLVSAESFPKTAAYSTALEHPVTSKSSRAIPATSRANNHGTKRLESAAESKRKGKPPYKKTKAIGKLHFQDDITTSPVLGLKIIDALVDQKPPSRAQLSAGGGENSSSTGSSGSPLSEFMCQLCRKVYADPLGLAQHKCSRIVDVEYRCSYCYKVFGCLANLASHQRSHKPKHQQQNVDTDHNNK